ncbi:uncharacterized protein N7459_004751 [Penicillium hispanicum]|uniref:uncharacterized protein n=1 Tax=Penicillium hispanicum TaxID=1080232 RepID=UPI0025421D0B|nr:uncharacterized protein N7459_004751 [Penicillium hispanicum]KAJ5584951.1 hypothetical protein N7459_004751 [Penicillium hispanicum]
MKVPGIRPLAETNAVRATGDTWEMTDPLVVMLSNLARDDTGFRLLHDSTTTMVTTDRRAPSKITVRNDAEAREFSISVVRSYIGVKVWARKETQASIAMLNHLRHPGHYIILLGVARQSRAINGAAMYVDNRMVCAITSWTGSSLLSEYCSD